MSFLMSKVLSLGALSLLASGALFYFYFASKFVARLRTRYERVWVELGSPVVMSRNSSRVKYFAYLKKKGYRELNDEALNRLGDLARKATYFMWTSMILAMAIIFAVGFICAPGSC